MAKRNQRKKSVKIVDKNEETLSKEAQSPLTFETETVDGKTCNVYEQEMTWKIPNYRIDKSYSVSFLLPRAIQW
jgi:hypothetical protein